MTDHLYAVIMAGGGGTRLWPLSRHQHPKQTLSLVEERTLFQYSIDRLLPLLPLERIYVVTAEKQVEALAAQYPQLPVENFIIEPIGRGTACCIGLAALAIRHMDPEAVMVVTTADHHIEDVDQFTAALVAAQEVADQGYFVTLGVAPTRAATGYGYIRRGAQLGEVAGLSYFVVDQFTEKPEAALAEQFVASGLYAWNSGMFIWRVDLLLDAIARLMPQLNGVLQRLDAVWSTPAFKELLDEAWPKLKKETIDYGIMERVDNAAVIPVAMGWSDIGIWSSVMDIYDADEDGNVIVGDVLSIDNERTMVIGQGDRLIAAVGLDDLIIVDTPDALLVIRRDATQRVRDVVEALQQQQRDQLL